MHYTESWYIAYHNEVRFFFVQETTLWRGTILSPHSAEACAYHRDGAVVVKGGRIIDMGPFDFVKRQYPGVSVVESASAPWTLIPGFFDLHLHWVQNRVKGSFQESLLPWLQNHIWPEEARFQDPEYAEAQVKEFYQELSACGTIAAMIYSSIHPHACHLAHAHSYGHMIVGDVVMTQNSPEYLLQDEPTALQQVQDLGAQYGDRYAVTPRFAITCGETCLEGLAEAASKNNNWIQTHLSENTDEIAWVKELFPNAAHYTDVYDRAGLLTERTVLGHCIHLSDSELRLLEARGVGIAHCPTSNQALRSGRMPLERIRETRIPFALATDIGGGPFLGMLDVMKAFMDEHAAYTRVTATEALFRATLAGAQILQMDHCLGSLTVGKNASFVALSGVGKPAETAEAHLQEILASDLSRLVDRTVVDGAIVYAR